MLVSDFIRAVYFFLLGSPLPFKVCAIFQLSIDCGTFPLHVFRCPITNNSEHVVIVAQRIYYGAAPPVAALMAEDDLEQALALADSEE